MPLLALLGFLASIPLANWLIGNVGTCIPDGPCLIPVAPGLMAPSGVLAIGLALVCRDAVHSFYGWRWAMVAIAAGAALSWLIAPHLAVASAAAFLLAETADLLVYAPLRERRLALAVLLSGLVGSVVDSAVFLYLAFGSLDFLAGNVIGKLWMSLLAAAILTSHRKASHAH
jgi:uncharacterized PurR-regulated membrane protein YhhQ (DUF165 family)